MTNTRVMTLLSKRRHSIRRLDVFELRAHTQRIGGEVKRRKPKNPTKYDLLLSITNEYFMEHTKKKADCNCLACQRFVHLEAASEVYVPLKMWSDADFRKVSQQPEEGE